MLQPIGTSTARGASPASRGGDFRRWRLRRAWSRLGHDPVVEDHQPTRTFLADNLAADGYDLLEADCAFEARRHMETGFPDLAIIDLGLPDGDGLELLRLVREADRVAAKLDPDLPLLVLTGRGASSTGSGRSIAAVR